MSESSQFGVRLIEWLATGIKFFGCGVQPRAQYNVVHKKTLVVVLEIGAQAQQIDAVLTPASRTILQTRAKHPYAASL